MQRFLKPLALSLAALAATFTGGLQLAVATPAASSRREDNGIGTARTPDEFVIARNSAASGGMLAHSSHSSHSSHRSHASHSSHYSGSSPTAPYTPPASSYTPAPAPVVAPTLPPYKVEIETPKPVRVRIPAAVTWKRLTIVHVDEISTFHHKIEGSDGHVYSVANKLIDWTPGDVVRIHAERSHSSGRWYYTLMDSTGKKVEAHRIK